MNPGGVEFIDLESRMVGARGWGRDNGVEHLTGTEFQFGKTTKSGKGCRRCFHRV